MHGGRPTGLSSGSTIALVFGLVDRAFPRLRVDRLVASPAPDQTSRSGDVIVTVMCRIDRTMSLEDTAVFVGCGAGPGRAGVRGSARAFVPSCGDMRRGGDSSIGRADTRGISADAAGWRRGDLADDRGHSRRWACWRCSRCGPDRAFPSRSARHVGGIVYAIGRASWILALATVIMVMGLVDDLKNLDWRLRLGIQFACAVLARRQRDAGHAVRAVHPSCSWAGR